SYIGSLQQIDSLGLDGNALLASHGAQGALRLNALSNEPATPFLFAGIAWRRYDLVNTDTNTSALEDSDEVFEFPFGLGISTQTHGVLVDLRGELRFVIEPNLAPEIALADGAEVTTDPAAMHRWGINLTVGVAL
ncbi:MAG: hypothetical protein H0T65_09190, partial [Deltaproteobacteria bacterium]|nr:hypothetical protein [Deltaproteobacteria bacterium]